MRFRHQAAILATLVVLATVPPAAATPVGVRLYGKIVDPAGEPIEGVDLRMESHDRDIYGRIITQLSVRAETDSKGRYRAVIMQAARHYLYTISKEGYEPFEELVEVTLTSDQLGAPLKQDFTLEPVTAPDEEEPPAGHQATAPPEASPGGAELALDLYNQAVALLRERDFAAARELLESSVALSPELAPAQSALAVVYLELGNPAAAIETAAVALKLDLDDVRAMTVQYRALMATGETDEARYVLDELIDTAPGPDTARLLISAGVAAFGQEDFDYAEERFRDAVDMEPESLAARKGLARALLSQEKFGAAAREAGRALEADPTARDMFLVRLAAYEGLGDEENLAETQAALGALAAGER